MLSGMNSLNVLIEFVSTLFISVWFDKRQPAVSPGWMPSGYWLSGHLDFVTLAVELRSA